MKLITITGNHPRHLKLLDVLYRENLLDLAIIEKRGPIIPSVPKEINNQDELNWNRHFDNRKKFEELYFFSENDVVSKIEHLQVNNINLDSKEIVNFLSKHKPTVALVFGTSIIKGKIFQLLPDMKINIHSGILPEFKGSAGNFWPFYFLKPNFAGITFHYLSDKLDGGSIIHQSMPELSHGDTIHEVSCKSTIRAFGDLLKLLDIFKRTKELKSSEQKKSGKLFMNSDFMPHHLRLIYNYFDDDIVDKYLNKEIKRIELKSIKNNFL